jgi:putative ABC transport system permease protein
MPIEFEKTPSWRRYLRFWGSDPAADVDAELSFHLESRVAELMAQGCSESDARRLAGSRFGDLESIRARCQELAAERTRAERWLEWRGDLLQDLRYGWRTLLRAPGFTITAILSLALGIGANTAIFGLMHSVLLARLPVRDPEQLISVMREGPRGIGVTYSWQEFTDMAGAGVALTASTSSGAIIESGGVKSREVIDLVDAKYLELIGVRPIMGRLLSVQDLQSTAPVVVISENLWRNFLNADPGIIGQPITINRTPFTVIGVIDGAFKGLHFPGRFSAAVPMTAAPLMGEADPRNAPRSAVSVWGRRTEGQTLAQAQAMLQQRFLQCCTRTEESIGPGKPTTGKAPIGRNMGGRPATAGEPRVLVTDLSRGLSSLKLDVRAQYRTALYSLMGGVLVLLLIACANVGTLLLARSTARSRELAIRLSLGAARVRLVRQLLTESLQLALLGASLGFLFAWWGMALLARNLPEQLAPFVDTVKLHPNQAVLGFTVAVTVVCSLLFGVLPALRATRIDLTSPMKESDPRQGGVRTRPIDRFMVGAQVALALLLVTSAGLLVQTLHNLRSLDAGYDRKQLILATADTRTIGNTESNAVPLYPAMLAKVRAIPGVQTAAMATNAPGYGGRYSVTGVRVPGYEPGPDEDLSTHMIAVTPGFFEASGIALKRGRDFTETDIEGSAPVAVVTEAFARRYFANADPIGAVIDQGNRTMRIIGIAEDVRYMELREPAPPLIFMHVRQTGSWPFLIMVARTRGNPELMTNAITSALQAAAPGANVHRALSVRTAENEKLARERLSAALATLFGSLALGLAAIGLYGVMAFYVTRRSAEIGMRMALGASRGNVLWLVLRQTMYMLAGGFLVGVPLTILAGRGVATQLFGVQAFDPITVSIALLVLTITTIIASLLPARRASRIDPIASLRAY